MPQYFGKLPTTNQPWTGISAVDGFRQDERNIIVGMWCLDYCLIPTTQKLINFMTKCCLVIKLMTAPIYRLGVEYRAVYLPEGTWFDWGRGKSMLVRQTF
jgi:hypothetical protein